VSVFSKFFEPDRHRKSGRVSEANTELSGNIIVEADGIKDASRVKSKWAVLENMDYVGRIIIESEGVKDAGVVFIRARVAAPECDGTVRVAVNNVGDNTCIKFGFGVEKRAAGAPKFDIVVKGASYGYGDYITITYTVDVVNVGNSRGKYKFVVTYCGTLEEYEGELDPGASKEYVVTAIVCGYNECFGEMYVYNYATNEVDDRYYICYFV
jgi:hypothetical protein